MLSKLRLAAAFVAVVLVAAGCGSSSSSKSTGSSSSAGGTCPNGKLTFGVEPYDSGPKFTAAYTALAADLTKSLKCPVKLFVTQNYTAEVEAMRAGKLDMGEFGPLGYVFAHKLASAQPVAAFGDKNRKPVVYYAGIWVPKSSSVTSVAQLRGKTIALADPASTSGSLYPLYALSTAGLKKSDVHIKYAGGHPASMLALTHGKTDAAELNTQQQATATKAGQFDASKYRQIWKSSPIENDPITVRADLPSGVRSAVTKALVNLTPAQLKLVDAELGVDAGAMVPASDSLYSGIRAVVDQLHVDLSALNS